MKYYLTLLFFSLSLTLVGQVNLDYQKPPEEILELVDIQRAPTVILNEEKEFMVLLYRDQYK